jgi:hypothetical protein
MLRWNRYRPRLSPHTVILFTLLAISTFDLIVWLSSYGSAPFTRRVVWYLDYDNGTLLGLLAHLGRSLQSIQNAAPRLKFQLRRSTTFATHSLAFFHWLRAQVRIKFEIAVSMYRVLHGAATHYLRQFVRVAEC